MRKAFKTRIGSGLYVGAALAFGLPLLILLVLGWYQYRAETLNRSVAGFGSDLSIFDAIRIDSRYSRWKGVLDTFVADPRPDTYAAFSAADKEWQQQLYDISAIATGPELAQALKQAQKARADIVQATDALAETAAFLTDAEQKIIITQTEGILQKLQMLRNNLKPGMSDQAEFISEVAAHFRDGLIVALQFVRNPDPALADKARQDFLWIAENLGQMTPGAALAPQVEDVRKDLSTFYTAFEQIATTAATQTTLREQLRAPTMVGKIRLANPLAESDWSRSLEGVEDGALDRLFLIMRVILTVGVVVLAAGLAYSLLHIRAGFVKPFDALLSFCSHAYITRRRTPVPTTDRHDEIGALARAVQAMLERLHQQYAITDEAPKSVAVSGDETTTALPAEALPAYLVGRLEQLEDRAREAGIAATTIAATVEQRAMLATDSARETEHSRICFQEACVALREIKDVLEQIDTLAERLLQDVRQAVSVRERLTIRQRNAQMTVTRLLQAVEALHAMADDVALLVQNTRRTLNEMAIEERPVTVTGTLSQLAQQMEEISLFFRLETVTLAEAMRQALPDEGDGMPGDQSVLDADTLRQRTAWCRSTLLDHFARLQEAAFSAGQQALQMLETSGAFMRVGAEAAGLRQRAEDMADDCGKLRRSMLYREPLSAGVPETEEGHPDAAGAPADDQAGETGENAKAPLAASAGPQLPTEGTVAPQPPEYAHQAPASGVASSASA
jgi:methyl-accepting chemotaxis protein